MLVAALLLKLGLDGVFFVGAGLLFVGCRDCSFSVDRRVIARG